MQCSQPVACSEVAPPCQEDVTVASNISMVPVWQPVLTPVVYPEVETPPEPQEIVTVTQEVVVPQNRSRCKRKTVVKQSLQPVLTIRLSAEMGSELQTETKSKHKTVTDFDHDPDQDTDHDPDHDPDHDHDHDHGHRHHGHRHGHHGHHRHTRHHDTPVPEASSIITSSASSSSSSSVAPTKPHRRSPNTKVTHHRSRTSEPSNVPTRSTRTPVSTKRRTPATAPAPAAPAAPAPAPAYPARGASATIPGVSTTGVTAYPATSYPAPAAGVAGASPCHAIVGSSMSMDQSSVMVPLQNMPVMGQYSMPPQLSFPSYAPTAAYPATGAHISTTTASPCHSAVGASRPMDHSSVMVPLQNMPVMGQYSMPPQASFPSYAPTAATATASPCHAIVGAATGAHISTATACPATATAAGAITGAPRQIDHSSVVLTSPSGAASVCNLS